MPLILPLLTHGYSAGGSAITRLSSSAAINDGTGLSTSYSSVSAISPTAGSSRCAVMFAYSECHGVATSLDDIAAEWGAANAFTRIAYSGTPAGTVRPASAIFYMLNADIPASAETITVTATNLRGAYAHLVFYENVNQSTPFGTPSAVPHVGSSSLTKDISVTMTETDSVMLSMFGCVNETGTPFSVSFGTELYDNQPSGAGYSGAAVEDFVGATGSRTHTYTANSSQEWAGCAVEMFGV